MKYERSYFDFRPQRYTNIPVPTNIQISNFYQPFTPDFRFCPCSHGPAKIGTAEARQIKFERQIVWASEEEPWKRISGSGAASQTPSPISGQWFLLTLSDFTQFHWITWRYRQGQWSHQRCCRQQTKGESMERTQNREIRGERGA